MTEGSGPRAARLSGEAGRAGSGHPWGGGKEGAGSGGKRRGAGPRSLGRIGRVRSGRRGRENWSGRVRRKKGVTGWAEETGFWAWFFGFLPFSGFSSPFLFQTIFN